MEKLYVKIIVEGSEEYAFFDVVKQIGVNNNIHLEVEDACGYGSIADALLYALREELFDCVICVYDVDNRQNDDKSPYSICRSHLISIFEDEKIVDAISFCTNPNILQFFLLAADKLSNVALQSSSKSANSDIVHKYWEKIASGKTDVHGRKTKQEYDASAWQLEIMKYSILNGEYKYDDLLNHASDLPHNYLENLPGSNLLLLLSALKSGNIKFFKQIKNMTDSVID